MDESPWVKFLTYSSLGVVSSAYEDLWVEETTYLPDTNPTYKGDTGLG